MKLTEKNRRIIAVILALILIATGVIQIVFPIKLNETFLNFLETIIMFSVLFLLFIAPKKKSAEEGSEEDEVTPKEQQSEKNE